MATEGFCFATAALLAACKKNIEGEHCYAIPERGLLNREVDGCQFLCIKTFKTQLPSNRSSRYCSGNVFFFPLSSPHIIDCRGAHVKSRGAQLPWKCHMLLWFWCGGVGIALGLMSLNDSISGYPAMFDCDGTLPPMDTLLGNSVNQVRDQ